MLRQVASYIGLVVSGLSLLVLLISNKMDTAPGLTIVLAIIAILSLISVLNPGLPQKKTCLLCNGSGYVPAVGAWITSYDSQPCSRCGGSGKVLQQSSLLEEDGFCMTEDDI